MLQRLILPARSRLERIRKAAPGQAPGLVVPPEDSARTALDVVGFSAESFEEDKDATLEQAFAIRTKHDFLWLDFDGLGDGELIREAGAALGIHKLTLEDIVHPHQRAKVEYFADYVYIVVRMVSFTDKLEREQLSIILGRDYVLTFQEGKPGDCLEPVRERLRRSRGGIRAHGTDYLAYALIDAVIDHYFPVLERYADQLEGLEAQVSHRPYLDVVWQLHGIRRELLQLQSAVLPQRDLVQSLIREPCSLVADDTRLHLRDVADHEGQLLDLLLSYREMAQALIEIHLNVASNRMNEVMQVLTIIGAIFMPLSFIAGVYGMNFDPVSPHNMPELRWRYGYFGTLALMGVVALVQLVLFYRKGWLGRMH
ncbi:MAG: magnesium/cobalt transporter CorA [Deltaproteobacteria bacterium]|nr:magnesium/cobalt transporter CorA [Deltaproteobacteria bacterium]